jgi:hypothetical protein
MAEGILPVMEAPVPLAHVGHWYEWVPYLIPVAIVLIASARAFIQQRRERGEGDATEG